MFVILRNDIRYEKEEGYTNEKREKKEEVKTRSMYKYTASKINKKEMCIILYIEAKTSKRCSE